MAASGEVHSLERELLGLDNLRNDTDEMVVNYIKNKIDNFSLKKSEIKKIPPLTKKYDLADILESIDLSASKYLRYETDGSLTQESAEEFINKIGGILVNKNKPPIEQKASYVKGICKNRFNYWNPKAGSIILNNYIKALHNYGWSEEKILDDLENEVIPKTKEVKNWSAWKSLIEKWTEDVNGWEQNEAESTLERIKGSDPFLYCLYMLYFYNNAASVRPSIPPKPPLLINTRWSPDCDISINKSII